MKNTKLYLTIGVEVALFVLTLLMFAKDKLTDGSLAVLVGAMVAVAAQYSIANVVASGQATKTSTLGADLAAAVGAGKDK